MSEFEFQVLIWGWYASGCIHPDPVMAWIESGRGHNDGLFDLTDQEMSTSKLYENGVEKPLPGWWRLLPAITGGLDPNG